MDTANAEARFRRVHRASQHRHNGAEHASAQRGGAGWPRTAAARERAGCQFRTSPGTRRDSQNCAFSQAPGTVEWRSCSDVAATCGSATGESRMGRGKAESSSAHDAVRCVTVTVGLGS